MRGPRRSRSQREFDRSANDIYEKGVKEYPDFEQSLSNFKMLGGLQPAVVEAAMETGEAAKVLYELGKNPDEAARIMALPPTKMAVAVAKIAVKPSSAPAVSKAPPPIKSLTAPAARSKPTRPR